MKTHGFSALCLVVAALLAFTLHCKAQTATFKVLHQFTGASDGARPVGGLTVGADGNFYGTTVLGGAGSADGYGTVFKLLPGGALTVLHRFGALSNGGIGTNTEGAYPISPLLKDADGNFYGTATRGGSAGFGTMFKITPAGNVSVSHSYGADEASLPSALIRGSDGNFYGNANAGGSDGNGTVFRLTAAGTLTKLHDFAAVDGEGKNADGARPFAPLLFGADGSFYGTTTRGGANGGGTVFKLTPAGMLTTLHSFGAVNADNETRVNSDGADANALIRGSDGNFYGTAFDGGSGGFGTVFKITSAGDFTVLHTFSAPDDFGINAEGGMPADTLLLGSDGNLYGTTAVGGPNSTGTVFKITPAGVLTVLHSFGALEQNNTNVDGAYCDSALIQGGDGNFYGMSSHGGSNNFGTIFRIALAPVITSATSASGTVGKAFAYQITATNNPTSFATSSIPPGLAFSTSTGRFSGTPTTAGTYKPLLAATNSGGTDRVNLNIEVKPLAPVITSALTANARVGVPFSYQITATNSPTSYKISSMPPGLTFNTTTGRLSGTPTKAGTYRPLVVATNSGGSGSANVNLTVNPARPVITSDLNPPARQGVAFSYQIVATNSPTGYATSSVPPGLTFNANTGRFSGTPTKAGTYKPLVSATNGGGTASVNLNLVVKPPVN